MFPFPFPLPPSFASFPFVLIFVALLQLHQNNARVCTYVVPSTSYGNAGTADIQPAASGSYHPWYPFARTGTQNPPSFKKNSSCSEETSELAYPNRTKSDWFNVHDWDTKYWGAPANDYYVWRDFYFNKALFQGTGTIHNVSFKLSVSGTYFAWKLACSKDFGNVKVDVMALDATVPSTSLLDEVLYTKDFHSNSSTAPCSYKSNEGGICGWDGTTATAGQSTTIPIAPTTTHIASSRTGAHRKVKLAMRGYIQSEYSIPGYTHWSQINMKTSMDLKVVVENMSNAVGLTPLSCSLCETGEEVVNDICTACAPGKYKNTTDDIPCKNCPSGWRSSTGNSLCTKCTQGKYQALTTSATCNVCNAGQYQDQTGQLSCQSCPLGYVASGSTASDHTTCDVCPAGSFHKLNLCDVCPAGFAQNSTGQSKCNICYAGQYTGIGISASLQKVCNKCVVGTYSNSNASTSCSVCGKGKIQTEKGKASCENCGKGKYNENGENIASTNDDNSDCKTCPTGWVATVGAQQCSGLCPGSLTNYEQSECTDASACQPGQFKKNPSSNCSHCPTGWFTLSIQSTRCKACPSGYFADQIQSTRCKACTPGLYHAGEAQSTACLQCPGGRYSSTIASNKFSNCLPCGAGKYQGEFGSTSEFSCIRCKRGRYSTTIATTSETFCLGCAKGKYSETMGATMESFCKACATGRYGDATGLTDLIFCTSCALGKYSTTEGAMSGSSCLNCPMGYYGDTTAAQSSETCKACSPGKWSSSSGLISMNECTNCVGGKYSILSSLSFDACVDCPSGFASQYQGASSSLFCVSCEPGFFAETSGSIQCLSCLSGFYSNELEMSTCNTCPSGYYLSIEQVISSSGTKSFLPMTACKSCEAGRASGEESTSCYACGAGSWSNTTAGSCYSCAIGKFQFSGMDAKRGEETEKGCILCPAGFVTNKTGQASCVSCSPGKKEYLDAPISGNRTGCVLCEENTYQAKSGSVECLSCPKGRNAKPGSVECSVCGTGKIRVEFNTSKPSTYRCETCQAGTYAQAGDVACSNCSSGYYVTQMGSGQCVPCVAGKFSGTSGAVTPDVCRSCMAGKYSGAAGQPAESACNNCPPGTASTTNGSTSVSFCISCAVGKASNSGSVACEDCEQGSFQAHPKQAMCLPCVPGMYQNEVGATSCIPCPVDTFANTTRQSSCTKCSIGKQAFLGSAQCQMCLAGEYGANCSKCGLGSFRTGDNSDASKCNACPAGFHQNALGQASCLPCVPGRYNRLQRQENCTKCAINTYAPRTEMIACIDCAIGKQADFVGSTQCQMCLAGEYGVNCSKCSKGSFRTGDDSDASKCNACPAGFHQNALGQASCLPCVPGRYNRLQRQENCTKCAINTYAPKTEMIACIDCEIGKQVTTPGAAACHSCAAGKFGDDCSLCEIGKFRGGDNINASVCYKCPTGYHQKSKGQAACFPCVPGMYQNHIQEADCIACTPGKFADAVGFSSCKLCPRGFHSIANSAACSECLAGSYGAQRGQPCLTCAAGYYRKRGGSNFYCIQCPSGFNQNLQGQAACQKCLPGKYRASAAGVACQNCESGKYRGNEDQNSKVCINCPSGFANKYEGQAVCFPCSLGRVRSEAGFSFCEECNATYYSNSVFNATSCKKCPSGYSAKTVASVKCLPCDAGTSGEGCSSCAPGRYRGNEDKNLKECIDCPSGFHSNENSQPFCKECDAGKYQDRTAQLLCKECTRGKYQESKKRSGCDLCKIGTFQDLTDQNICKSCPASATTVKTGAPSDYHCLCKTGTFATRDIENENKLSCVSCPPRSTTLSNNKTSSKSCVCADNFWKAPNVSNAIKTSECIACPQHAVCKGGKKPMTKKGYWRVEWREENTADVADKKNLFKVRLKCLEKEACLGALESGETTELVTEENSMSLVAGTGTAYRNVTEGCLKFHQGPLCAGCKRGSYKQSGSYLCVECYVSQSDSEYFLAFVVFATFAVIGIMTIATVADGGKAVAVDMVILKIAFNSGIISAGASNFPLKWPPAVMSMFQMYAVGSATVIGDSLSTDCVLRDSEIRPVQAWGIAAILIPPGILFTWFVLFQIFNCVGTSKKYMVIHFPVSTLVTLLFAHPVVSKSAVKLVACRAVAGKRYMDADFNVSCDSEEYKTWVWMVAVPIFVLYTIGIPTVYFIILWRHVKHKTLQKNKQVYGFLFSGFRPTVWWFELWNTLRKSLFTIVAVLLRPLGANLQTWAALVLLLFFIVIFSLATPYEHAYLNRLESWALSINVVTLLLGLGLFTNAQNGENQSEEFAYTLSLWIIGLNVLFVWTVVWTLIRSPHAEYCICFGNVCKRKEEKKKVARKSDAHLFAALKLQQNVKDALNKRLAIAAQKQNEKPISVKSDAHLFAALKFQKNVKEALNKKLAAAAAAKEIDNDPLARRQRRVKRNSTLSQVRNIERTSTQQRQRALKDIERRRSKSRMAVQQKVDERKKAKGKSALKKSIFSGLSDYEIATVIDCMLYETLEPGAVVCKQGDEANIFYVIIQGVCDVIIDGQKIDTCRAGEVFGESALFLDAQGKVGKRTATVAVSSDEFVQILSLPKKKFDQLVRTGVLDEKDLFLKLKKIVNERKKERLKDTEIKLASDKQGAGTSIERSTERVNDNEIKLVSDKQGEGNTVQNKATKKRAIAAAPSLTSVVPVPSVSLNASRPTTSTSIDEAGKKLANMGRPDVETLGETKYTKEIEAVRLLLKTKARSIKKFQMIFGKVDQDHNGSLSKKEFKQLMQLTVRGNKEFSDSLNVYFDALWVDLCQTCQTQHNGVEVDEATATKWLFK